SLTLSGPTSVFQGAEATFSAVPYDPGPDDVVSVSWQWGDGRTDEGASAVRSFAHIGVQTVTVYARDGDGGLASYTMHLDVENAVPAITGISTDAKRQEGTTIGFEANITNPAGEVLG